MEPDIAWPMNNDLHYVEFCGTKHQQFIESFAETEQTKSYIKIFLKNIGRTSGWYFIAQQKKSAIGFKYCVMALLALECWWK